MKLNRVIFYGATYHRTGLRVSVRVLDRWQFVCPKWLEWLARRLPYGV